MVGQYFDVCFVAIMKNIIALQLSNLSLTNASWMQPENSICASTIYHTFRDKWNFGPQPFKFFKVTKVLS